MQKIIIILFSLLMFTNANLYAADYYWVGGSGDWSDINHWATTSGGTTKHIQTPTSNDNVIFDVNSMSATANINLNSQTIFCRNFDIHTITNTLNFSGVCKTWRIYGGISLSTKMNSFSSPDMQFEGQSGTHNLEFNGKTINFSLYFLGTAAWVLTDTLICEDIHLKGGTFSTGSNYIDGQAFYSSGIYNKHLNLGSSSLQFMTWIVSGNTYTVNAGNSHITIHDNYFRHNNTTNQTYYNVTFVNLQGYLYSSNTHTSFHKMKFDGNGVIIGNNTYDSLIFTKKCEYYISPNTTQTIIQDFVADGNCKNYISIKSSNGHATFSKNNSNITINYTILNHIHASGGANFYAVGGMDLGDNTGWIIQAPPHRILYWVGDSGDWSDTLHWSLSSGGPGGECIPTTVDDVVINTSSFNQTLFTKNNITLDVIADCHDFTWMGQVSGEMRMVDTLRISGSCFFGDSLRPTPNGTISFISNDIGETIETSNINLNSQRINFWGQGGWQLLDSLNNGGGRILHARGHLNTDGQYVHAKGFYSSGIAYRELSLGSTVIDLDYKFYIIQDSLIIFPNTSHIRFIGDSSKMEAIGINPVQLYNVSFLLKDNVGKLNTHSTTFNKMSFYQDMELSGEATSDTLFFDRGRDYVFNQRSDSIIRALIANANCMNTLTMREKLSVGEFIFRMGASATVSLSYANLRGSKIIGSTPFTALNSGDLGMNTGWTFSFNSVNHYWVGGQGNWHDSIHWSYSSGGQGGACIPMIYDDVFFDANSFNSNDTVIVDTANIFCRNMDWSNATNSPVFSNNSKYVHFISGSLELNSNMSFKNRSETFFVWDQKNKTIKMSGHPMMGITYICDTGRWTLLDTLTVLNTIIHIQGQLIANLNPIQTHAYVAISGKPKLLDIHNVNFNIISKFGGLFLWNQSANTTLLANNSHIRFLGGGDIKTQGAGQTTYYNVSFLDSNVVGSVKHDSLVNNVFNRLFFQSDGFIYGQNTMDSLHFSKGGDYLIQGGYNQIINQRWIANADCYGTISIKGVSVSGSASMANFVKQNGNVLMHSVKIKNINATGNNTFTILDGYNLGGNSSNWQITPTQVRTLYWVNSGGDWFDTTHWSLLSGGSGGECIPTYKDDVFIDSLSFTNLIDTVSASMLPECHDLIWGWTPSNPAMFIAKLNIYGSIALGDTMHLIKAPEIYMRALDTTNFIKSSSKTIQDITFLTNGGWRLLDNLNVKGNIIHKEGSFRTMGNDIFANGYQANFNSTRKIDIQNSNLILRSNMILQSNNLTFLTGSSNIIFDSTDGVFNLSIMGNKSLYFNNVLFAPIKKLSSVLDNKTALKQYYNKVVINNMGTVLGENVFDSLIFHSGNTYELEEGIVQRIIDYWYVRGNNCYALNLQSTKKNYQAYVSKTQGVVSGDFINIRDIGASGGASFFAGDFSTDISNNTGWNFSNGPQYVYGLGPSVNFNLGGSTTLTTVNFNGGPYTTYLWSNGSTNPTISVNQTGWYFVTVTYAGGCIVNDSIFVGCNLNMNYNITDNICNGDSLGIINALIPDPNFFYTYQWSTGDTLDYTDNLPAGSYTVLVSADSGLCMVFDTLIVGEPPPVICPQGDTAFCVEDSVQLNLGTFTTYLWSDNYKGQFRWISQPDTFIISVEDPDGCWSAPDTISIREDQPPFVFLGNDTTICLDESVLLDAGIGMDEYLWSTNSTMSNITVYYTGEYWVKIRKRTCIVSDTIELINCPPKFIVPNVFTPNGDGFNDVFNIDYQNIWEFEVCIYDRWGGCVFRTDDIKNQWNGMVNGREVAEGVYFWEIIYQEYNGKGGGHQDKAVRGTLSLFRSGSD
ncbi:MAG: gliding motility-associated C-terminal domain-containing protein [Bacteroidales bacterium]|nr:gliding motility-associated C-terminal domain-containing protein [Bacteroidales bacterium]